MFLINIIHKMDNIADTPDVNEPEIDPGINVQWVLTLEHKIPANNLWHNMLAMFPIHEIWVDYLYRLNKLQVDNRFRLPLSPYNFRDNEFKTPLLKTIVDASRTVDIKAKEGFVHCFRTLLTYRELYRYVLGSFLASRIEVRVEALKAKAVGRKKERIAAGEEKIRIKGIPIRTFHIQDNSAETIRALSPVIHQVEFETGSTLNWQSLTTYTNARDDIEKCSHIKNKSQWIGGVSGDGCNLANIRSWTNTLSIRLKNRVDVIVVNGTTDTNIDNYGEANYNEHNLDYVNPQLNTAYAIGFALSSLNVGGCAMIYLEEFHSSLMISCIHIFSIQFADVRIIHTRAEDRLFLCGINFIGGVSSRLINKLYDVNDTNISLFAIEYMNEQTFISTVEMLASVAKYITKWRLDQYTKLINIYHDLSLREQDTPKFSEYQRKFLEESYPSIAKEWSVACKYE